MCHGVCDGVCVCVEEGGGGSSHRSACECVFDTHAAGKADLDACFDENKCLCVYKLEQEPAVGRKLPWTKNEQTKAFSLFGIVVVLASKIGGRGYEGVCVCVRLRMVDVSF